MRLAFCLMLFGMALTAQTSIAGKWHLLRSSEDEENVPRHRVDLVFRAKGTALTGAVINRVIGDDIPVANLKFDGNVLTLQMGDSKGQAGPLILTMMANGDKFEGRYLNNKSEPIGPVLKLVRFRDR
jgi:hypothetical protein